jgi:hypothetical protein
LAAVSALKLELLQQINELEAKMKEHMVVDVRGVHTKRKCSG